MCMSTATIPAETLTATIGAWTITFDGLRRSCGGRMAEIAHADRGVVACRAMDVLGTLATDADGVRAELADWIAEFGDVA